MVSSETGGMVDCSVGSIVWVRRRNGSWWPGKILGQDELSSSIITSPRSGTPVKLLGREDASVDWYNLEKSKRVKSFRCGDFDECIERAEAAQGMPPKKREKYARREDAILHALELERQLLEKKYGKLEYSSNGRCKRSPDAVTSAEYFVDGGGKQKCPRSSQISERLGTSLADKNTSNERLHGDKGKEGNQLSGDDDSPGVLPRMRGLQDIGLSTAPPPREELPGLSFYAKRSRYGYVSYDSGDSSNDNRSRPHIEVPISRFDRSGYLANMGEDHISGSTEDTETDCSETDSLGSDSDDELVDLSDGSASIELQPKYPRRIGTYEEHGSVSSTDDFDELTSADATSHPFPHDPVSTRSGVSRWQLKGKRNSRILGKRSLERPDTEVPRGYINGRISNWSSNSFKSDLVHRSPRARISRYGDSGLHNTNNDNIYYEGFTWDNQSAIRDYWEDLQEYGDTLFADGQHVGGRIMLVDVDLKVQANNYRRDVPMISLMSKLNGHAIVGHPIQIEALESGSSEKLLTAAGYILPESLESPTALPPVWRTGRRTANSRVPRPRLSSTLDGDDNHYSRLADQEKKLGVSRYSPRKSLLNQKIRTLSSIASVQKHNDPMSGGNNSLVDGLIKTESVPTAVACIPVKLVFSRLHEELVARHQ